MKVNKVKEVVSRMFGVGKQRVWIDPSRLEELEGVMTRDDIRRLMDKGVIKILPKKGQSRFRANILKEKKKKGRRKGPGSRKGSPKARMSPKILWIKRIRAIRRALKVLRAKGIIDRGRYRKLYLRAKGGAIRSKSHLNELLGG